VYSGAEVFAEKNGNTEACFNEACLKGATNLIGSKKEERDMTTKALLGAFSLIMLAGVARAQTTRMSAEEKIKELQQQMLDMQSKMQE